MEKQIIGKTKTTFLQSKAYFHSETQIILESTDVEELLSKIIEEILYRVSVYLRNGPGWYFKEFLSLGIHTVGFKPMNGSSYIPLPEFIRNKNAVVNLKNKDQKCFLWRVLRYIYTLSKIITTD